jgi:hypothetical protein
VGSATTVSHLADIIFTVVKYLVAMDGALTVIVFVYAAIAGLPLADTIRSS